MDNKKLRIIILVVSTILFSTLLFSIVTFHQSKEERLNSYIENSKKFNYYSSQKCKVYRKPNKKSAIIGNLKNITHLNIDETTKYFYRISEIDDDSVFVRGYVLKKYIKRN